MLESFNISLPLTDDVEVLGHGDELLVGSGGVRGQHAVEAALVAQALRDGARVHVRCKTTWGASHPSEGMRKKQY